MRLLLIFKEIVRSIQVSKHVRSELTTDGRGNVWRLKEALHGLKQAAREWHKVLAKLQRDLDFVRCHNDPALYVRKYGRCIIFIWVDDLL